MQIAIITQYQTNMKGAGQIKATSGHGQVTISYDHSRSVEENHVDAVVAMTNKIRRELDWEVTLKGGATRDLGNGKRAWKVEGHPKR